MNLSPTEAEEALASIRNVTQKTRHSIAGGGATISLIITGVVWLIGFTATHFLAGPFVLWIWIAASLAGGALATVMGLRLGKHVRSSSSAVTGRRIAIYWLLLIMFGAAAVYVVRPTDGKQLTLLIILLAMIGQMGMGLLLSFSATWWTIPVVALALAGYFFASAWFYLWMALLGGGVMILLGVYIRYRW